MNLKNKHKWNLLKNKIWLQWNEWGEYCDKDKTNHFALWFSLFSVVIWSIILSFIPSFMFLVTILAISGNMILKDIIIVLITALMIPQIIYLWFDQYSDFMKWRRSP